MMASDVIVALLVASMPATLCRSTIFRGVSVNEGMSHILKGVTLGPILPANRNE